MRIQTGNLFQVAQDFPRLVQTIQVGVNGDQLKQDYRFAPFQFRTFGRSFEEFFGNFFRLSESASPHQHRKHGQAKLGLTVLTLEQAGLVHQKAVEHLGTVGVVHVVAELEQDVRGVVAER
jgi:hypothetical protein